MKTVTEQVKQLEAALGNKYTLMQIDEDWCLYRDLGNGFDIEINLHGTRSIGMRATIHVWQVRDKLKIIETIRGIQDIDELRSTLRYAVIKTNRLADKRKNSYMPIAI